MDNFETDKTKALYIKMKVTEEEKKKIKRYSADNLISISDLIRLGLNTVCDLGLEYGNQKRNK